MAAIDSVYSYYLSTYGDSLGSSRFESHKKSELRATYNAIIKSNKNSPLYKINDNGDLKKFAIDIKEQARSAKNVVSSLSTDDSGIESLLYKKVAESSDPDAVSVNYIGSDSSSKDDSAASDGNSSFKVGVVSLAKPQINTGNYLRSNGHDFESGTFSFDLDTANNAYEFEFTVNGDDSNRQIQDKIAKLINSSDVGLSARVLDNAAGDSALELTSKQTGLSDSEDYLFRLQSGSSWNELNRLGINQVSQKASSSVFTLNGSTHSSLSNTFTINQKFEITLKNETSSDSPVSIGFKTNTDAINDSVSSLLDSYNSLLSVGRQYSSIHSSSRLISEVQGIANTMGDALSSIGISSDSDGNLSLDRDTLASSITGNTADDTFSTLNKFKNRLAMQADKLSINPMNYVDKLVVEYKNPQQSFSAPYAQSAYAGLLMDHYL